MAAFDNGQAVVSGERADSFSWNGEEFNQPLSGQFTHALMKPWRWANLVTRFHPGLYFARYDDIPSVQLDIRPSQAPLPAFDLNALLGADQLDPTT